jgi:hypothetical protein
MGARLVGCRTETELRGEGSGDAEAKPSNPGSLIRSPCRASCEAKECELKMSSWETCRSTPDVKARRGNSQVTQPSRSWIGTLDQIMGWLDKAGA